jgi:hypothetical protein
MVQIEFNSNLALRSYDEFKAGKKGQDECLPEKLEEGKTYMFLKQGQRTFWLEGDISLVKTDGDGNFSRPLASVRILEVTHYMQSGKVMTRGKYTITKVFFENIHGMARVDQNPY